MLYTPLSHICCCIANHCLLISMAPMVQIFFNHNIQSCRVTYIIIIMSTDGIATFVLGVLHCNLWHDDVEIGITRDYNLGFILGYVRKDRQPRVSHPCSLWSLWLLWYKLFKPHVTNTWTHVTCIMSTDGLLFVIIIIICIYYIARCYALWPLTWSYSNT